MDPSEELPSISYTSNVQIHLGLGIPLYCCTKRLGRGRSLQLERKTCNWMGSQNLDRSQIIQCCQLCVFILGIFLILPSSDKMATTRKGGVKIHRKGGGKEGWHMGLAEFPWVVPCRLTYIKLDGGPGCSHTAACYEGLQGEVRMARRPLDVQFCQDGPDVTDRWEISPPPPPPIMQPPGCAGPYPSKNQGVTTFCLSPSLIVLEGTKAAQVVGVNVMKYPAPAPTILQHPHNPPIPSSFNAC